MAVYLLHSTVPLVHPSGREVRHYLGCTEHGRFPERLAEHRMNRGSAKVVQAFLNVGGELWLGNYWPTRGKEEERRMKQTGHLSSKCLLCRIDMIAAQLRRVNSTAGTPMLSPIVL